MKRMLCGLLACTAATISVSGWADSSSREYNLELVRSSVRAALIEFSKQTGLQTAFYPDDPSAANIVVGPLSGHYTAEEALGKLLAASGLSFQLTNERMITVLATDAATSPRHGDRAELGSKSEAQAQPEFLRLVDRRIEETRGELTGSRLVDARRVETTDSVQSHGAENQKRAEVLAEIVVTGTNIRGVSNDTAPIVVLDKEYIDSTGVGTSSALMESLTQNFALASQSGVTVPGVSSAYVQGSSINLRGIGEGTTLVLIDGHRVAPGFNGSAADISSLPLSAVERVEILTDGASAVYGADAVGGVVNFILRKDFDGAETRLRTGWADGGVNEYRFSQAVGTDWNSGGGLVSVEYYKRDLLPARARDFVPDASVIGSLYPRDRNYSATLAGRQTLTDNLGAFVNALYVKRDSYNEAGRIALNENNATSNPQASATAGIDWGIGRGWTLEVSGSYARNKLHATQNSDQNLRGAALFDWTFEIQEAQVKADGALFTLPSGDVRVAIGADWRSESFTNLSSTASGAVNFRTNSDQTVQSGFAEMLVPVIKPDGESRWGRRLELSLAGRFDDYSTFGSSFDPKYGAMWEPTEGLRLRGSYGTSYKAPNLTDYNLSANAAVATRGVDPGAAGGTSYRLQVAGIDVGGFSAQRSESSSFGIELSPVALPGLDIALNYYNIKFRDQIAIPPSTAVILANPASFAGLVTRDPSIAQVNDAIAIGMLGQGLFAYNADFSPNTNFSPDSVDVIVDQRRRNLSAVKTSGLDLAVLYGFSSTLGDIHVGANGTYIFERIQQITPTSAPFDTVDTYYNPPHWRARASVGWQRQAWAVNTSVNHSDAYVDNRTAAPVAVSSYTTVDARLAYDFGKQPASGFLAGVVVSASVQNLFDSDPPPTAIVNFGTDMGFDPTNANPMGRFLAIELIKSW